ncbi:NAD-dependent deacylase, partial [bacterium]|nr:NAD-dependent deacylase [bacterium]
MGAPEAVITDLTRRVADAQSIVVFTGAGMSAESGVPTYRGQGGLWKNFRAQDLATLEAFDRDPALVWGWYRDRRNKLL